MGWDMDSTRATTLATAIVFGTGVLWGFYWIPVRSLAGLGLAGAWGTVAITAAATLVLMPAILVRRQPFAGASPLALGSIALGGAAFALYSIGFVYGRVAIIILLYFLTPVWSTLIGRYVMGWHTPPLRILAIVVGLAGLGLMLSAGGQAPLPRSAGEWMGLIAGVLWSVATTGIRAKSSLEPVAAAFVFALGALVAAAVLAPFLEPSPAGGTVAGLGTAAAVALGAGGLWWGLSTIALLWATARLEPARVGILLMSEVVAGAASAAVIAGELLSPIELAGGALVLVAGLLEVWPTRRARSARGNGKRDRA
jgi:drug/metabolite transporter (DMT)-like permease